MATMELIKLSGSSCELLRRGWCDTACKHLRLLCLTSGCILSISLVVLLRDLIADGIIAAVVEVGVEAGCSAFARQPLGRRCCEVSAKFKHRSRTRFFCCGEENSRISKRGCVMSILINDQTKVICQVLLVSRAHSIVNKQLWTHGWWGNTR